MKNMSDYKIKWYNISPIDENEELYTDEEDIMDDEDEWDDVIDFDDEDDWDEDDIICRECGEVVLDGLVCEWCGWIVGGDK